MNSPSLQISVGKPQGRRRHEGPRHRWYKYIKMDLRKRMRKGGDRIDLGLVPMICCWEHGNELLDPVSMEISD